ncbi:hypothetical protein JQ615_17470 [Bradyrhizobium jicamae]|uniref:Uncharacterized protein n=1 Tax=Bradyrhizobium jicamae TaxID=280332 RepID=A0ABS5FK76_9BRAD|nr:hypothetical protein [Bradyrhizobium jicamae]MBR0797185.1 hypothetical protein [Bradyrhizobium jicamae]MBR0934902.1 hypothetical protein [Bradyrhizobium jicamae]
MFQLFLRTRAHNIIKQRLGERGFRARSAERDAETDRARIGAVMSAIDTALHAAESEQLGLARRVEEVLARAAVTLGNGTDEYLEREALDSYHQDLFDAEIVNGQRRLKELAAEIAHFKFVKATALTRFPDYQAIGTGS